MVNLMTGFWDTGHGDTRQFQFAKDTQADEDLYQELCITLLNCIRNFRI